MRKCLVGLLQLLLFKKSKKKILYRVKSDLSVLKEDARLFSYPL